MRKVLLSLAATTAVLVTAAPASAQYHGQRHGYGYGHAYPGDRHLVQRFNGQIGQLQHRIERLAARRAISGTEYQALRRHSARLQQRLHRFAYDGLSRGEVQDIADRIDNLHDRIRDERRDGRRYYRGW